MMIDGVAFSEEQNGKIRSFSIGCFHRIKTILHLAPHLGCIQFIHRQPNGSADLTLVYGYEQVVHHF